MAFLDILGTIASPVTSLVGGFMNMIEGSNNRDFNEDLQYQSQDFQREMFNRQNAEYDRRFNLQKDYNDPKVIVSRNAQAGINPIFGTGGNNGQTFGAPDPSVQSPPSSVTPPYVNMSASGDLATSLEKMGSFVSSLASARKDVAEGTSIAKLLDGQIENQQLSNLLRQQEVIGSSIDNIIKGNTGLKKALMDIRLLQADINLKTFQGFESESRKALYDWQSFAEQAKTKLSNAEYLKLMQLLPLEIKNQEEYNSVLKSEGKKYRAEADQASAAAGKIRQETKTEKWNTKLKEIEADLNETTKANKLEALIADYAAQASKSRATDLYAKLEKQRLELVTAIKNKNWKKVDAVLNYMKSLSPDLISITGSVAK